MKIYPYILLFLILANYSFGQEDTLNRPKSYTQNFVLDYDDGQNPKLARQDLGDMKDLQIRTKDGDVEIIVQFRKDHEADFVFQLVDLYPVANKASFELREELIFYNEGRKRDTIIIANGADNNNIKYLTDEVTIKFITQRVLYEPVDGKFLGFITLYPTVYCEKMEPQPIPKLNLAVSIGQGLMAVGGGILARNGYNQIQDAKALYQQDYLITNPPVPDPTVRIDPYDRFLITAENKRLEAIEEDAKGRNKLAFGLTILTLDTLWLAYRLDRKRVYKKECGQSSPLSFKPRLEWNNDYLEQPEIGLTLTYILK